MAFALWLLAAASGLTGLWHTSFTAPDGSKRELHLAVDVQDGRVKGNAETETRTARLIDGKLSAGGFTAVAESNQDGRLWRRRIDARLDGDILRVGFQAWPEGSPDNHALRWISAEPVIPGNRPEPLPPLQDLVHNGLAKTPPMGWSSRTPFGCQIDDAAIREVADALVTSGMKQAGYLYVNIDDCWQGERDASGTMRPHPQRFPDLKALADYVHAKGLKIGIYSSPGPRTCAGFEGSYGHEQQDARTWAEWGIDFLTYDWCSAGKLYQPNQQRAVFQKMAMALRAAGRPIVYGIRPAAPADVSTWGGKAGANLWRTAEDPGDNWKSAGDIGFEKQLRPARFAGPGRWNDPGILQPGNGMSLDEFRARLSLWAILAAPLITGIDVRSIKPEVRDLLINPDVIAIDQDPLGRQGTRAWKEGDIEVWTRPLHDGSTAVGIFNRGLFRRKVSPGWRDIGLQAAPGLIHDIWRRTHPKPSPFGHPVEVAAHGVVLLRVR